MKLLISLIAISTVFFILPDAIAKGDVVTVAVPSESLDDYNGFINSIKKKPTNITNFTSPFTTRAVVTLVLLRQALKIGDFPHEIRFIPAPNSQRAQVEVRSGKHVAVGTDIWSEKFDRRVFKSKAIILEGQFIKGIYGLLENKKLFAVRSLKDLQACCNIVSSKMWAADRSTIEKMKLKNTF